MVATAKYRNNFFHTASGFAKIVPQAEVTLYTAGTDDPLPEAIYTSRAATVEHGNPFEADEYGNIEFWLNNAKAVKIVTTATVDGVPYELEIDYEPVLPYDPASFLYSTSGDSRIASILGTTGQKLLINQQAGWNELYADFNIENYRLNRLNDDNIPSGAANMILGQIVSDGTTLGGDATTVKFFIERSGRPGVSGSGVGDEQATARVVEISAVSYKRIDGGGLAGTAYPDDADPTYNPSFRGLDIGYSIHGALPATFFHVYDGSAINIYNSAAGSAEGGLVAWANGRAGSSAIAVWGSGNFNKVITALDSDALNTSDTDETYWVFTVRKAGGTNMMLLQSRNEIGTGIRFSGRHNAQDRKMDAFMGSRNLRTGFGSSHGDAFNFFDPVLGLYAFSLGVNQASLADGGGTGPYVMQARAPAGSVKYPGLTFFKADGSATLTSGIRQNAGDGIATVTNQLDRITVDTDGNVVLGGGALATTAVNGFFLLTSSAGPPTGVPPVGTYTGRVPIHIDTTNHRIYIYSGGAWRFSTTTT